MYQVEDKVMHRQEGACRIKEIVNLSVGGNKTKEYYLLIPLLDTKASIYISMDAAKHQNIRPIIEIDELEVAQKEARENPLEWIENPKLRFGVLTKNISEFQFGAAFQVMECLKLQSEQKRLCVKDEGLYAIARKMVLSELAMLFNAEYEKVAANPYKYLNQQL